MCDGQKNGREPYTKEELLKLINTLSESDPVRIAFAIIGLAVGATIFIVSLILVNRLV